MGTESKQKHPGGRPTKYTPLMIDWLGKYYTECKNTKSIPYLEEFCMEFHIDEDKVGEYSKLYPEFHGAVKRLKQLQKKLLEQKGLSNNVNVSMAIFLLKANHGMIETEKKVLTGDKNDPLQIEIVESIKNE